MWRDKVRKVSNSEPEVPRWPELKRWKPTAPTSQDAMLIKICWRRVITRSITKQKLMSTSLRRPAAISRTNLASVIPPNGQVESKGHQVTAFHILWLTIQRRWIVHKGRLRTSKKPARGKMAQWFKRLYLSWRFQLRSTQAIRRRCWL